jgi:hypothetical protein
MLKRSDVKMLCRESGLQSSDPRVEQLVKSAYSLGEERERDVCSSVYMQLFLDPENQPTQFGTATQEYRAQEIEEEREKCVKAVVNALRGRSGRYEAIRAIRERGNQ